MSIPLLVFISAVCGYLFLVSKQRRRRGLPPLPIIGPFFDAILDADDQRTEQSAATTSKAENVTNEEAPRPVAVLKNDVGDFMAYPDESSSSSTSAPIQPHPVIAAATTPPPPKTFGESVMFQPPPEQSDDKRLPGTGMTSTYLMQKQVPESPVSPLSTTSPQSAAFPVNEQKATTDDINVPAPTPLPPADNAASVEPDSKESKDSQEPQKKKKKSKRKKSKSKNKDSKDKKRWSKHKHHDKKKKEATVVDPNNNIPPIL